MEISIPPLRDHKDDILILAKLFIEEYNKEFNKNVQKLDPKTERLLLSYPWPGNVRELKNVIERGIILCKNDSLLPENLPMELQRGDATIITPQVSFGKVSLQEMERHHIKEVLKLVNGNKSQAARILDISRSTLREKLKNYETN